MVTNIVPEADRSPDAVLFSKMAAVMGAMSRIPKTGHNKFHNYRFATSEDVADAIRTALAEENIAFFPSMKEVTQETIIRIGKDDKGNPKERTVIRTRVTWEMTFACGDTGATKTSTWESEAEDDSDKGINKAATSAEKYFLMKTFVLSSGDEKDADKEGSRGQLQSKSQETPAQPQAPTTNGNAPLQETRVLNWATIYTNLKPLFAGNTENVRKAIDVLRETGYIKPEDNEAAIILVVEQSLQKPVEQPADTNGHAPAPQDDVDLDAHFGSPAPVEDKPTVTTSYEDFLSDVTKVVSFMHKDPLHAKNNVKKLWREKKISAEMSLQQAAVEVFLDRAATKSLTLTTDIWRVACVENPDTHFSQNLEPRLMVVWEKVVEWDNDLKKKETTGMSDSNPLKATVEADEAK